MADKHQHEQKTQQTEKRDEQKAVPGQSGDVEQAGNITSPSADVQAAEHAGISEGEVKALRDDAHLNHLAGHEASVFAWVQSDAGKEFLDTEKDRVKKYEDEEKAYAEQHNEDGLTEAEVRYFEAVDVSPRV